MKIRYKNRFDKERRDIMKTIAKAGISSGLLRSCSLVGGMMIGRAVEAQSGPNKSILLLAPGGGLDEYWTPRGGMQLGPMSSPYEDVKNEMTFVSGGSMAGGGGHGAMFRHFGGGFAPWSQGAASFDVIMGKTIGENRPIRYLNLGAESNSQDQLTHDGGGVPTINSPTTAFSLLQGNLGGDGGGGGGGGGGGSNPRRLYVDAHKDAIAALKQRLGQHEREKLDSHLTSIEELEGRLADSGGTPPPSNGGGGGACSSVSMPSETGGTSFEETAHLQIEIAMLALKCNITNSVSIAFGDDQHEFYIPTYADVVHDSHHCCPGADPYITTVNHMSGLCARTIRRAKEEGLLDSTLITQVSDMGDARAHDNRNVPMFVAGGGGAIGRGRVVSAGGKNSGDLFQGVANALGANQHPAVLNWSSNPINL